LPGRTGLHPVKKESMRRLWRKRFGPPQGLPADSGSRVARVNVGSTLGVARAGAVWVIMVVLFALALAAIYSISRTQPISDRATDGGLPPEPDPTSSAPSSPGPRKPPQNVPDAQAVTQSVSMVLQPGQLYSCTKDVSFYQTRPDSAANNPSPIFMKLPPGSFFMCAGIERPVPGVLWYRVRAWDGEGAEYDGWLDGSVVTLQTVQATQWSASGTKGAPAAPNSATPKSQRPDSDKEIVYVSITGRIFHEQGCSDLDANNKSMSRDRALAAGYSRCTRCKAP
jgi:hypothetical protein